MTPSTQRETSISGAQTLHPAHLEVYLDFDMFFFSSSEIWLVSNGLPTAAVSG